jgi:hypothetical protein
MLINWWEGNPKSIVLLRKQFLDSIDTSRRVSELIGISQRALQRWKSSQRHPTLHNLLRYISTLNISRESLTKDVLGFAAFKGRKVWYIQFPLEEHPSHAGIIAHGFFDGNECCGVLVYGTLTKEENDDFARLALSSNLGAYLLNYSRDRKGLPASVTQLLKNHYGIKTFLSDCCVFSDKIMSLAINNGAFRKEILRAAFLDEGHVTLKNGICAFGIKNPQLTDQLCRLLSISGYRSWSAETPSQIQVYLTFDSAKKFYEDILFDMPDSYRKKERAIEFLAKLEATNASRKSRSDLQNSLLALIKKLGKVKLSEIYETFKVEQRNKKTFYNKHIRKLKNLHLIETTMQGGITWVHVPESGKSEK